MRNLIKADLKRVWKDKLFIVLLILAGVFAVITPVLYKVIFATSSPEELQELSTLIGPLNSAKTQFFTSFSPSNNFGMILPILLAIILCKDFSHGTIRNKVICGKSRTKIYFSLFLTCAIYMFALILLQALLTLAISLLFFEYQAAGFSASDFGYLMASIALEFVVYLFISALLIFMIVSTKNAGIAIVFFFAVNFLFQIIGAVTSVAILFTDPTTASYETLQFFNNANMFTSTLIGGGMSYTGTDLLTILLPNIILAAGLTFFGLMIFRKKDLK